METLADFSKIDRLLEKTEKEFSYVKPGSDEAQLPLRDLLATLRDVASTDEAFVSIHFCAAQATSHVEAVLDSLRSWAEADMKELRDLLDELAALRRDPSRVFTPPPTDFAKIDDSIEKLGLELSLAAPGTDGGQLPVRDLLARVRDKSGGDPKLAQFNAAAVFATDYVESVLEGLASWTADELASLRGLLGQLRVLRANPATVFVPPATVAPAALFASQPEAPLAVPVQAEDGEIIPLVFDIEADGEMIREFIIESHEHLTNIENGILELEGNPRHKETLNTIFRAFHTFKGSSGFLNLVPINKSAHELEGLLDLARQDKLAVTTDVINLILEMQAQMEGKKKRGPILISTAALIARVKATARGESAPAAAPKAAAPAASKPAPEPVTVPVAGIPAASAPAPAKAAAEAPAVDSGKSAVVKVDTVKLDGLFDLVGEIVIAQSLIAQDADIKLINSQRLTRNLAQLGRITDELQKTAMSMRMVPIRGTFQKMNRVVRDISAKLGKHIDLVISGEDTELDRTIVDEISDPLLHMIRNSLDHGIEMADVRIAKGKNPNGTISLSASHEGGNIVIRIIDDGAGINTERVLRIAKEKGIVAQDAKLTDQEIFRIIFAAGFSTAETVTDVSGRGVGMDVVVRNITKLRGKIDIDSVPNKGSTFTISLPLTLAIIEGLIIRAGDQRYILPTLSVRESFRITSDMLSTLHEKNEMVTIRGSIYPLVRLHELFKIKGAITDPLEGIVVMIEAGHQQACLLVDDLVGKQEVVIKSLGEQFKSVKALAGAAILGDGNVGLILDTAALINRSDATRR